jgi:hypothetical protein
MLVVVAAVAAAAVTVTADMCPVVGTGVLVGEPGCPAYRPGFNASECLAVGCCVDVKLYSFRNTSGWCFSKPIPPPPPPVPPPHNAMNVLFIAVDDLRAQFGRSFADEEVLAPNIDKFFLDGGGSAFQRSYVQIAVHGCSIMIAC